MVCALGCGREDLLCCTGQIRYLRIISCKKRISHTMTFAYLRRMVVDLLDILVTERRELLFIRGVFVETLDAV